MGMTIEDYINIIKNWLYKGTNGLTNTKQVFKDTNCYGTMDIAKSVILKALEQEPCDDCVSRKAVLEMAKSYNTDGWDSYTPLVVDVEDIEELPQVTPIRPKGHWIEEFYDIEGEVRFICSSCGKYQLFGTDFCYNCGSDNREVEE
jgi:hypothetical protein